MFISDKYAFLELHKTGSSQIQEILNEILDGKIVDKHNRAHEALFDGKRTFLGSIRDPWEWYCSLWAYGCDQRGAVFQRTTQMDINWRKAPLDSLKRFSRRRNAKIWQETYSDPNDAGAFRAWLTLMHDPEFAQDICVDFARSDLNRFSGLMTFRYLSLYCTKQENDAMFRQIKTPEMASQYDAAHCFINDFIHNERLEHDLLSCLKGHGTTIPTATRQAIFSRPKANTSSRRHGPAYYYDPQTIALIAKRDWIIIERFGYKPPRL